MFSEKEKLVFGMWHRNKLLLWHEGGHILAMTDNLFINILWQFDSQFCGCACVGVDLRVWMCMCGCACMGCNVPIWWTNEWQCRPLSSHADRISRYCILWFAMFTYLILFIGHMTFCSYFLLGNKIVVYVYLSDTCHTIV